MLILLQYLLTNFHKERNKHKETNYTNTTLLLYLFERLRFSRGVLDVAVEALIVHSRITYDLFVCNSNLPALSSTILIHSSQFQPISPRISTPLQGQDNSLQFSSGQELFCSSSSFSSLCLRDPSTNARNPQSVLSSSFNSN